MSLVEDIEKLNDLRQSGAISEQEYQQAKESLLAKNRPAGQKFTQAVDGISSDTNMWGMLLHLSQFCGYIVPLAGLVVPIVLWQIKKDESEIIDRHGKIVVNWIITEIILGIVFGLLCFVLIGVPLLLALALAAIMVRLLMSYGENYVC